MDSVHSDDETDLEYYRNLDARLTLQWRIQRNKQLRTQLLTYLVLMKRNEDLRNRQLLDEVSSEDSLDESSDSDDITDEEYLNVGYRNRIFHDEEFMSREISNERIENEVQRGGEVLNAEYMEPQILNEEFRNIRNVEFLNVRDWPHHIGLANRSHESAPQNGDLHINIFQNNNIEHQSRSIDQFEESELNRNSRDERQNGNLRSLRIEGFSRGELQNRNLRIEEFDNDEFHEEELQNINFMDDGDIENEIFMNGYRYDVRNEENSNDRGRNEILNGEDQNEIYFDGHIDDADILNGEIRNILLLNEDIEEFMNGDINDEDFMNEVIQNQEFLDGEIRNVEELRVNGDVDEQDVINIRNGPQRVRRLENGEMNNDIIQNEHISD